MDGITESICKNCGARIRRGKRFWEDGFTVFPELCIDGYQNAKNKFHTPMENLQRVDGLPEVERIYVSIGLPGERIPFLDRVLILLVEGTNETPVQAAKKFRKHVADNICDYGWMPGAKMNPAGLYYVVYKSKDDTVPFAWSENAALPRKEPAVAEE